MSKLPAFHFYSGDWQKDPGVQALSMFDRAIWFEMLLRMHESEKRGYLVLNGNPIETETLTHMLGVGLSELEESVARILKFGVASKDPETGAIFCRRMVRDEEKRQINKNNGKKGGRPTKQNRTNNPKHNPIKTESITETEPNHKGSVSVSSSFSLSEEKIEEDPPPPLPYEEGQIGAATEAFDLHWGFIERWNLPPLKAPGKEVIRRTAEARWGEALAQDVCTLDDVKRLFDVGGFLDGDDFTRGNVAGKICDPYQFFGGRFGDGALKGLVAKVRALTPRGDQRPGPGRTTESRFGKTELPEYTDRESEWPGVVQRTYTGSPRGELVDVATGKVIGMEEAEARLHGAGN